MRINNGSYSEKSAGNTSKNLTLLSYLREKCLSKLVAFTNDRLRNADPILWFQVSNGVQRYSLHDKGWFSLERHMYLNIFTNRQTTRTFGFEQPQ